ncbi:interferon alpha beta receptor 1-like [Solea senegalensis]|uniref:Interferon alpha beta receptor 1-like n=1 Tax=Solea senegalensis TaxID=28829 RepID=A0AAV6PY88_SOLSE|nr:interleukin-10 receptor subunit alpha isoform X2 [Solea senegalensis]KAG7478566.1 interferon alpha beta receptor 1-like [Solea senegalensis]
MILRTSEIDKSNKMPVLLSLVICINSLSAAVLGVPKPADVKVNISDGEVIVYWKQPVDAPSNSKYNVEMAKYIDDWAKVRSCTKITNTFCVLSGLIHDYNTLYKVRVQLVVGDDTSVWTSKKVRPNESKLSPPTFTLLATSSTLSVYVHQKPILRMLFPYGLTYTIYLEEAGQNKTTIAYLKDDVGDDQRNTTFRSLKWERVYCVSMSVEGNGAIFQSPVSSKQCLLLPEREWFVIAAASSSILGVLAMIAIIAIILMCYLRRPEKTPAALKSPVRYWLPLPIEEGVMETVTDRGWFLSSYKPEVKNCDNDPQTHVTVTDDNEKEDRRTSMDSGVSMESSSATNNRGSPVTRQGDSGCGSMGGPESSSCSQADYPLQDEGTDIDKVRKREDSGVGLGCQIDSFSVTLDQPDSRLVQESGSGGNYRTQSPSAVQIHEEEFKQKSSDTVLAEVVTGYRAGPQLCICSGAGQCTWCHKKCHSGSDVIKQNSMGNTYPSCYKKSQMDTVTVDDFTNTFSQLGEMFPLLTTLPPLPLLERGHDLNMNNVFLSLSDIQLNTD